MMIQQILKLPLGSWQQQFHKSFIYQHARYFSIGYPGNSRNPTNSGATRIQQIILLHASDINRQQVRNVNFMNTRTGEELWKCATAVSNHGRKKGRGRGRRIRDLNRGQVLGKGVINYQWPGLNAPVFDKNENLPIKELPRDQAYHDNILRERLAKTQFKRLKLKPLERGYAGTRWPGRKLGPPEPVGAETFAGFETYCLQFRAILKQTGNMGKKKSIEAMVVTGNYNRTIGFGLAEAPDGRSALRKAKKFASKRLISFDICDRRTIYHNIFSQFHGTKLFMMKQPEGYGLKCHRGLKIICQLIGIKDMYAKVEGSTNIQNLVKTFISGLNNQRSHQDVADETGMYVVEQHEDRDDYPVIVGVPRSPHTRALSKNERMQLRMTERFLCGAEGHFADGKIYHFRPFVPWYWDTEPYHKRAWRWHLARNKGDVGNKFLAADTDWDRRFHHYFRKHISDF